MALWLCKCVIISKITYAAVAWRDSMDIVLARSKLERMQRATCIMITGAIRTTPTKVLEMFLDLPTLKTVVESAALMAAYHLPRPKPKNLGKGHNWICAKADKMNNKYDNNGVQSYWHNCHIHGAVWLYSGPACVHTLLSQNFEVLRLTNTFTNARLCDHSL